ncbi:hypothetical protein VP1G_06613 [Cytospora mali]|uniref:Uncharacterized protein n=1 Tax=Cytospora mali TaxID=578113 RepID=A0A194V624_CYTMA|nr:hypothetical protein VP1G_06613 [Valsa mali var. pyri (nom. inval.)]
MASISDLPAEVILYVIQALQEVKDISALSRSGSRFIRNIATPILYSRVKHEPKQKRSASLEDMYHELEQGWSSRRLSPGTDAMHAEDHEARYDNSYELSAIESDDDDDCDINNDDKDDDEDEEEDDDLSTGSGSQFVSDDDESGFSSSPEIIATKYFCMRDPRNGDTALHMICEGLKGYMDGSNWEPCKIGARAAISILLLLERLDLDPKVEK